MLSLKLTHMTSENHHASYLVNNNTTRYTRCHPTGRVSIGLGAVLLLDVNHDYYCTY